MFYLLLQIHFDVFDNLDDICDAALLNWRRSERLPVLVHRPTSAVPSFSLLSLNSIHAKTNQRPSNSFTVPLVCDSVSNSLSHDPSMLPVLLLLLPESTRFLCCVRSPRIETRLNTLGVTGIDYPVLDIFFPVCQCMSSLQYWTSFQRELLEQWSFHSISCLTHNHRPLSCLDWCRKLVAKTTAASVSWQR